MRARYRFQIYVNEINLCINTPRPSKPKMQIVQQCKFTLIESLLFFVGVKKKKDLYLMAGMWINFAHHICILIKIYLDVKEYWNCDLSQSSGLDGKYYFNPSSIRERLRLIRAAVTLFIR